MPADELAEATTQPSLLAEAHGRASDADAAAFIARWRRQRLLASGGLSALFILLLGLPPVFIVIDGQAIPLPLVVSASDAIIAFAVMSFLPKLLGGAVSQVLKTGIGASTAVLLGAVVSLILWKSGAHLRFVDVSVERNANIYAILGAGVVFSSLAIGMWSLAIHAPANWEQQRIRALQMENLRLEAAELRTAAEMARLRGQLEPHFLLKHPESDIGGSWRSTRTRRANILACLGDLLRDVLVEHGETHRMEDEIEWLRRYCEIQETRHGSALTIQWDIDESTLNAAIPRMLLQPLVENAVRHGALKRRGGGTVRIGVQPSSPGRLRCLIADSGPGMNEHTREGAIGIRNVRRRLELTCPEATFSLTSTPEGTQVCIDMPSKSVVPQQAETDAA